MHSSRNLIAALALCSLASTALAQFPGRGDSGRGFDRGRAQESRRGGGDDRERWRGGSRDGGESGDRDRWSRGSRGGWGGSRDGGERDFRGSDDGSDRSRGGFSGGFGGGPGGGFGGPPGGFRPDPGAMFDRLDRNGDGRLDGDEVENMPGFFRGMLDRAGIGEGASRDDFARGFDRMREGREQQESGDRSSDRSRSAENNNYFKPAERPRVTLELPDAFRDRDLDGDGQIGFYEWREWDRTRIDEFLLIDLNGDGFLTPKELESTAGFSMGDSGTFGSESYDSGRESSNSDFGRRFERGSDDSSQRSSEAPTTRDPSTAGFDENDPRVSRGLGFFKLLDANGDGKVNPGEWSASRRLKPLFESAGARLDRDLTQEEFLSTYLKTDG